MKLGPDGEPTSTEGYVLKRMLLEKGKHIMQAGIRYLSASFTYRYKGSGVITPRVILTQSG